MTGRGRIQLSNEEINKRRQAGLCFTCNEKYTWNHVCPNAKVMSLLVEDLNPEVEEEYADTPKFDEEPKAVATESSEDVRIEFNQLEVEEIQEAEISFSRLNDNGGERALKLEGHIGRVPVRILVDSGATLNFISTPLVEYLRLPVTRGKSAFRVTTGSGHTLMCDTSYEEVPIVIQGVRFHVTLFSIPLPRMDVVFGMPWLRMISPLVMDCQELCLNFWCDDELILLKGIGYEPPLPIDVNMLDKELASGGELYLLTSPGVSCERDRPEAERSSEIVKLLREFKDVEKTPVSLPPQREFDHRIRLTDESKPVNVAPYRYAYFQKNEIEKQVEEMMSAQFY